MTQDVRKTIEDYLALIKQPPGNDYPKKWRLRGDQTDGVVGSITIDEEDHRIELDLLERLDTQPVNVLHLTINLPCDEGGEGVWCQSEYEPSLNRSMEGSISQPEALSLIRQACEFAASI